MTEHQIDNSVILSTEDPDFLLEWATEKENAEEEAKSPLSAQAIAKHHPEAFKTIENLRQKGYSNFKCYPYEGGYLSVNLDTPNGKDRTFILNAKTGVIEAVYD